MKIAMNWFEVTLPMTELLVPTQTFGMVDLDGFPPQKSPQYTHRVIQRRGERTIRLLHITDSPPSDAQIETMRASEDPDFVKLLLEESFAKCLSEKGFFVHNKHVGRVAYLDTDESLWKEIYTFLRGMEFRAFYFRGGSGIRWGIVLNYATSQRFALTLADPQLRALAIGKRVVRTTESTVADDESQRRKGILLSVEQDTALVDLGGDEPVRARLIDWTLVCRRELLVEYVAQTRGHQAAAELTRSLQQASFCLTESGRMNTSLAKSQVQAIQNMLREHALDRLVLPLPNRPLSSLSSQPLMVAE